MTDGRKNDQTFARCLQEVENSDEYWGPAFRLILNNTDNLDNRLEFQNAVNEKVNDYDQRIQDLCNKHYNDFLNSVRELPEIRKHRYKLEVSFKSSLKSIRPQDCCGRILLKPSYNV